MPSTPVIPVRRTHQPVHQRRSAPRHRAGLRQGLLAAAMGLVPAFAAAADLSLTGGASGSNSSPVTYGNVTVSGQSGGISSTYTADAAFTATGGFSITDTGIFVANADTTASSGAGIGSGAQLVLNAGQFDTPLLSTSGSATVVRGSGVDTLRMGRFEVNNASLTLKAGDEIHGGQFNHVYNGGTVTNTGMSAINGALALAYASGTTLSTFESNVPVTFSGGADLLQGRLNVNANTTFAGNGYAGEIVYVRDGSILNLNSGTLSAPNLSVYNGGRVNRSSGAYAVTNLGLDHAATLDYKTGDSITGNLTLSNSASLTLDRALTLTGGIDLRNSGSLVTGAHNYSAASLNMDGNVALTYKAGDLIASSGNVTVTNNSTLTLQRNLDVNALFLGNGSTVSRTSESLRMGRFEVNNASLTLKAGDEIHGGQFNHVYNGGTVTNTGMSAINGALALAYASGTTLSTFESNVPVTFSGGADLLQGRLNVNANTTFAGNGYAGEIVYVRDGSILNLNSGTLSAPNLSVYNGGRVNRSSGAYAVTNLSLSSAATLTYVNGDSITGALALADAGTRLTEVKPLVLSSLSIGGGADLMLTGFTGNGYGHDLWALSLLGDASSQLFAYLADGRIKYSGVSSVNVTYDALAGRTFLFTLSAVVPEIDPAGLGSVVALVGAALGLAEKRLRSRRDGNAPA